MLFKNVMYSKSIAIVIFVLFVLVVAGVAIFVFRQAKPSDFEQQVIQSALELYNQARARGMNFSSQCLGTIEVRGVSYAVDIVHVPRSPIDNLPENQCKEYREGKVRHFIELDKEGNIVRIV